MKQKNKFDPSENRIRFQSDWEILKVIGLFMAALFLLFFMAIGFGMMILYFKDIIFSFVNSLL